VQLINGNEVDVGAHQRQQAALQGSCGSGLVGANTEVLEWSSM